jgi:hypothetical protein
LYLLQVSIVASTSCSVVSCHIWAMLSPHRKIVSCILAALCWWSDGHIYGVFEVGKMLPDFAKVSNAMFHIEVYFNVIGVLYFMQMWNYNLSWERLYTLILYSILSSCLFEFCKIVCPVLESISHTFHFQAIFIPY